MSMNANYRNDLLNAARRIFLSDDHEGQTREFAIVLAERYDMPFETVADALTRLLTK